MRSKKYHEHVEAVIDETGINDPREAVRYKARALISSLSPLFPNPPPFNMNEMASCIGLHSSDEEPTFSADSEIAPDSEGRVVLRVNKNRPLTRQRFSIAHEIGHTLFPDYHLAVRCRKAHETRWTDDDFLETLCDVAASEFMFPLPWFTKKMESLHFTGSNLAQLADECLASREAMARRIVELAETPMAAVYFSWKLKPLEQMQVRRDAKQVFLFDDIVPEKPVAKLRVDYAIMNDAYRANVPVHIPKHKSIENCGPIFQASITQIPCDGEAALHFGKSESEFDIVALPIYTDEKDLGPDGAVSVVAILRPVV